MSKISLNILILIIALHQGSKVNGDPGKIVENFEKFSDELLERFSDSAEASDTKPGVHLYNPFGVGYLLANINEQLWSISNKGIPAALRTLEQFVHEDYAYLLGQYKKNKFKITSTIYSRFGNVTKTPGLSKLLSHLITLDFIKEPAMFIDSFSSILDMSTKGHLDNEILPKALWQKVFDNYTQGAYFNTMHYKIKFTTPWTDIGQRAFNYDTIVKFLEVEGEYPVYTNDNITAVIVEIQKAPSQHIIFAKPNSFIPFPQLKREVGIILASNVTWPLKKLRIQIPALNVTNLSRHHLGLTEMGINETFCRINGTEEYDVLPDFVQQPITQANHFQFAPGYIELSSATGSIVNSQQDQTAEEDYQEDFSVVANENEEMVDVSLADSDSQQDNQNGKRHLRTMNDILSKSDGKCEVPEDFGKSRRISENGIHNLNGKATLIFDTPFMWIIRDGALGETFSGSLTSLCNYNKVLDAIQSSPAHAWLNDVFKVAFWKCI